MRTNGGRRPGRSNCTSLVRGIAGALILASVQATISAEQRTSEPQKRPVSVRDVISMTRLGIPDSDLSGRLEGLGATFSPDREKFVVVLKKGNLERNTNDYSVLLYHMDSVLSSPRPELLFMLSSSSNREAVRDVRWLSDSQTLVFIGENPMEIPQVYEFSLVDKHLSRVTTHTTPVVAFDVSADGKTILFEADPKPRRCLDASGNTEASIAITTQAVTELLDCGGTEFHATNAEGEQLFLVRKPGGEIQIPVPEDVLYAAPSMPRLSLSPDGRFALIAACPRTVPVWWSEYDYAPLQKAFASDRRRKGDAFLVAQYLLLDTERGELRPLLNSPAASPPQDVVWAPDGASFFLSGVRLPLDNSLDARERDVRKQTSYVVEVKLPAKEILEITSGDFRVKEWNQATQRLLVAAPGEWGESSGPTIAYAKQGLGWKEVPRIPGSGGDDNPVRVAIEEGPNSPPKLYASDSKTGKKALLLDLNPQFSKLDFGGVQVISWRATDGHEVQGGLFLPSGYEPGRRYPLVIQTHGFLTGKFYIDGPWSSAFAAQPLSGKGIVVVQVGYSLNHDDQRYVNTPDEAPREMAAYEGVIDFLDQKGLINRNRVGIIGFSRTVYKVAYTLTHSRYQFAAATLADGIDGGFYEYLLFHVENDPLLNGGLPFGRTLCLWVNNAPEFSMDKVHTPVRLEAYGPTSALGKWNWFSGLSILHKPVDFIYLPHATHLLNKPSERIASQQGNVDWFCFWLKGEEDEDQGKRDQYERWETLRGMLDRAE
jgi:dipeptidyl aminopeptidase/acylaminoacyl peptidase